MAPPVLSHLPGGSGHVSGDFRGGHIGQLPLGGGTTDERRPIDLIGISRGQIPGAQRKIGHYV